MKKLLFIIPLIALGFSFRNPAFIPNPRDSGVVGPPNDPYVVAWLANIGSPAPSANTIDAMNIFVRGLRTNNIDDDMININMFVPDSLKAASTPIIANEGYTVWSNLTINPTFEFTSANVSVQGVTGNGNAYFDTGVTMSTSAMATDTSAGMSIYVMTNVNESVSDMGSYDFSGNNFLFQSWFIDIAWFQCYDNQDGQGRISLNWELAGDTSPHYFFTASRTSLTKVDMYTARSDKAFGSIAGATIADTRVRPIGHVFAFNAMYNNTTPGGAAATKTYSFMGIHKGLNAAQSEILYNLVQACRIQLGGGWREWEPQGLVSGMTYFFDYRTLNTNFAVAMTWTDRVSSVIATSVTAPNYMTNTPFGVRFVPRTMATLPSMSVPSGSSFWCFFQHHSVGNLYEVLMVNNANSHGWYLYGGPSVRNLTIYNGSPQQGSTVISNTYYSWQWAPGGLNWTNGVSSATTPTLGNILIDRLGEDDFNDPFAGYIKFIGIWTNKTLTTTDAVKLSEWGHAH